MLTSYTKERLSRPILSKCEENQPQIFLKQTALDKLKTLKPGELQLVESNSSSDESDVDPFSDLKLSKNIEKGFEKTKKKLTRLQQSLELMKTFTEDFKIAMDDTRDELKAKSKIYYEDMDEINKTLSEARLQKNLPKSMEEKLNEIFRDEEFLNCGPDLDIPDPRDKQKSDEDTESEKQETIPKCNDNKEETSGKIANNKNNLETSDDYDDMMSGIWNMLKTKEELICTPPNFDVFNQGDRHWLDREGISWDTLDEARVKCVNWMKKLEEGS